MNSTLSPSTIGAGMPKMPKMQMPKPIKVTAPKIASVHVSKPNTGGGFIVQHNMTHGPKPKPFVFQDPAKMASHLKRIQTSAWRMPDKNIGAAEEKNFNLGPTA
jgi:hypothetical protein